MKIYFAASIRGGNEDAAFYQDLIQELTRYGEVLTEHIGQKDYLQNKGSEMSREEIYNQDMNWLQQSDVVVAEITTPSLGVGYEIAQTEYMEKPILCLFREDSGKNLSAMIGGSQKSKVVMYKTFEEVQEILEKFFSNLQKN